LEIIKIEENIIQFTFVKENSEFPLNITTLIDGSSAIIIDVAYEQYATQVRNYLSQMGVSNFIIFISHHHEDHFDGCKSFTDCKTYASELFSDDYQEHLETDEYLKSFRPDEYFTDSSYYTTKNFSIKFIYTPGHNKCEFSFLINEKYLYIGDLIFYNKHGVPSLPYLDNNSTISEYLESLRKIMKIKHNHILLGHGHFLNDEAEIKKQIENRLYYLVKIQNFNGDTSLDDCLVNDKSKYSGLNFHKTNLMKNTSNTKINVKMK
jgi:glyoxylase-like metal-dependent hydrolase (beta-lactamase superfamily II)